MSGITFAARERARLTEDLYEDIYQLIHTHAIASTLTTPEVIGVLTMLTHELIAEQAEAFDEDDDDEPEDDE